MNKGDYFGDQNKLRRWTGGSVIFLGILAVATCFVFRPHLFTYHSIITSNQNIFGKVFRASGGIFIVRLDSGIQMTLQDNPPRAFLLTNPKMSSFSIGRFLLIPASELHGLDLSKSESFDRQVPIVKNGVIIFKDPMNRNGIFWFFDVCNG